MKSIIAFLFIVLQLIESTGTILQLSNNRLGTDMYFAAGRCQLQATVRIAEVEIKGENETVNQTQLELLCSNTSCLMTDFTTCDTYSEFNIPRGTKLYV